MFLPFAGAGTMSATMNSNPNGYGPSTGRRPPRLLLSIVSEGNPTHSFCCAISSLILSTLLRKTRRYNSQWQLPKAISHLLRQAALILPNRVLPVLKARLQTFNSHQWMSWSGYDNPLQSSNETTLVDSATIGAPATETPYSSCSCAAIVSWLG